MRRATFFRAMATAAVLLVGTATLPAAEPDGDLRTLIELQRQQLEAQKRQLEEQSKLLEEQGRKLDDLKKRIDTTPTAAHGEEEDGPAPAAPPEGLGEEAVRKLIADFLQENPGAGMPPGVQTGYTVAPLTPRIGPGGFVIRSAPNPSYVNWKDDCRIPFELRLRGRLQLAYVGFDSNDSVNHLTELPNTSGVTFTNYSQLVAKRINLIAEGTAFDPDLRYRVNFNGFSRGSAGFQNNEVSAVSPAGGFAPNGAPVSPIGGGVLVNQAVTLFEAFVAYDIRGRCCEKGCGTDCPASSSKYCPTYTLLAGKLKPFFGLDEFLGNQNMQFVEFSMADLFFSADDDARLMAAGFEVRAFEDRFFMQSIVTNGSEAFTPNLRMDDYPGFITGAWWDFGGNWNEQRRAWDLFGDSIADIAYSCRPVARVGGCVNLVPMNGRNLYGDAEQARYFVVDGGPGGTSIINLLNGGTAAASPGGSRAVNKFDAYSYSAFAAAKWRGLSLYNEWWFRNLNNFESLSGQILYTDTLGPGGASRLALFPNRGLLDYGMNVSAGCFVVPRRLELAARWAWVSGQSGNINGNGTFSTVVVPGVGPVHVVNNAFRRFEEANEYTLGVNYYFKRNAWKWQTDFSIYEGGNPAGGGQSIAGFIAGVDGYMLRTQIQLFF